MTMVMVLVGMTMVGTTTVMVLGGMTTAGTTTAPRVRPLTKVMCMR